VVPPCFAAGAQIVPDLGITPRLLFSIQRRPPQLRVNGRFPRGPTPITGGRAAGSQVTSARHPAKGASTHWLPFAGRPVRAYSS